MQLEKEQVNPIFTAITTQMSLKEVNKKCFGIDMNNLMGVTLQQIRNLCNKFDQSNPPLQQNLVIQITAKQEEAINQIQQKIQSILNIGAKVVAVFDGNKTQKIKQIRTYILEQKREGNLSQETAIGYLAGKSVIQNIFYKKKYELETSQTFWQIYQKTLQIIIYHLKRLEKDGVSIFIAPYEADSQLIKLFEFKKIDIVVSKDRDYVNHGVPLLVSLSENGSCSIIDVSPQQLSKNQLIQPFKFIKIARSNPIKRAMFSALVGSKHLPKVRSQSNNPIPTGLLVQIIAESENLVEVFEKIKQSTFKAVIKHYYKQLAELSMLVELISPFFNPNSGKVECSSEIALQMMKKRLVNLENMERIWNYQYTKEVRQGLVNIHTGQKRDFENKFVSKQKKTTPKKK